MKAAFAALALALALAGPAAGQQARPSSISLHYNISSGPFTGEATYNFTIGGATYEGRSARRLTGFARTVAGSSQDYTYAVRGQMTAQGPRPTAYQHQGGRRGRIVRTTFTATDAITTAEPAMGMGNPPATAAQKAGSIDQVTMFLAMALKQGNPCQGTLRVLMDGRSRVDFVLAPNGVERVSLAGYRGEAARCSVQYRPIAGFPDPAAPMTLTFVFAQIDGVNAPLRIEIPGEDNRVFRLEARSVAVR